MKRKATKKKSSTRGKRGNVPVVKKKKKSSKSKAKENKGGNTTDYKPEYAQMAFGFASDGNFSCRSLAKKFHCSPQTILNWKEQYPDFEKAIEQGKEIAVDDVEQTYFKLATPHSEVTHNKGETAKGSIDYKSTKKDVVDAGACRNILAAHRKDKYGKKIELGGTKDRPIEIVSFAGMANNESPNTD